MHRAVSEMRTSSTEKKRAAPRSLVDVSSQAATAFECTRVLITSSGVVSPAASVPAAVPALNASAVRFELDWFSCVAAKDDVSV
eukprot:CAMPEP_0185837916 /NCGR_PEP_ID=MMETSP1353-20130828/12221_1 /TAXON_ID=1077150 /ORGANISM="Erythrolobus australicus, Strain CCMP3124" /LENGTH=83 /DNA_ID=CAMNT_0028536903 /DNA_START=204 /DNA_END=455 /DNA_ORIENTATION=+